MNPVLMLVADRSAMFTSTVVIAGISIVIGVLLFLILIFYLFGQIVSKTEEKAKKRAEAKAAKATPKAPLKKENAQSKNVQTASAQSKNEKVKGKENDMKLFSHKKEKTSAPAQAPAPAMAVQSGIGGEVVAAIAAAVAMYEGPQAVVRSVRKVNIVNVGSRNPWAAAALADNTRPF